MVGSSRRFEVVLLVASLGCGAAMATAGGAWAASGKAPSANVTRLDVAPKAPKATDSIVVRFRAGALRAGERYLIGFGSVSMLPAPEGFQCTQGLGVVLKGRKRRGQNVEVELYPNGALTPGSGTRVYGAQPQFGRFCAGRQTITVGALNTDGDARLLASRKITVARDAAYPEPVGTPAKVILLDGSSVTVQAQGRPDRTLPLAGTLAGLLPGRFMPNTDLQISTLSGALSPRSIVPDPLCAGAAYTTQFGLAPGPTSTMTLLTSGRAAMSLDLLADARSIAGCATPASPGTTTVLVTGTTGPPDGLTKLPLSGTIPGVQITPDVTATLTFNLLVKVDLSGRA